MLLGRLFHFFRVLSLFFLRTSVLQSSAKRGGPLNLYIYIYIHMYTIYIYTYPSTMEYFFRYFNNSGWIMVSKKVYEAGSHPVKWYFNIILLYRCGPNYQLYAGS